MILASINAGNHNVTLNCEIGEFTVTREHFDFITPEYAMETMESVLSGNPVAIQEFHAFMAGFDKEMRSDIVRVFAYSV